MLKSELTRAKDAEEACIFLQEPFADCFCLHISSSNICKMLAFCTGDYRSCPTYRQKMLQDKEAGCDTWF